MENSRRSVDGTVLEKGHAEPVEIERTLSVPQTATRK
jgi:hypothetical protein